MERDREGRKKVMERTSPGHPWREKNLCHGGGSTRTAVMAARLRPLPFTTVWQQPRVYSCGVPLMDGRWNRKGGRRVEAEGGEEERWLAADGGEE